MTRIAVTPSEAAEMLGVSRSYFYEHILPELGTIYRGRKRLIHVRELERWAERASVLVGGVRA